MEETGIIPTGLGDDQWTKDHIHFDPISSEIGAYAQMSARLHYFMKAFDLNPSNQEELNACEL